MARYSCGRRNVGATTGYGVGDRAHYTARFLDYPPDAGLSSHSTHGNAGIKEWF